MTQPSKPEKRWWRYDKGKWDKLRPINKPEIRDLRLLCEWNREHPGEYAYYPRLCLAAGEPESGEVAKLRFWGCAESKGEYSDGNRSANWRATTKGHRVDRDEEPIPRYCWESDKALWEDGPWVYASQVRERFNLISISKWHWRPPSRTEPPEWFDSPQADIPPEDPPPPTSPPPPPTRPSPSPSSSSSAHDDPVKIMLEQARERLRKRHQRG